MKTTCKYFLLLFLSFLYLGMVQAQSQHWQFDQYVWEYDMTVYVTLILNNNPVNNLTDYEIATFCETECRGVSTIQSIEKDGLISFYGYLRIRSNQQTGETMTFKVYDKTSEKEYDVEDYSISFHMQSVVGLPSSPVQLFILDDCNISLISADETMGIAKGGTIVKYGENITITATANEGYHFVNWTDNGTIVSGNASYSFMANSDLFLVANFAPNKYTMTFVLDNGEENIVKSQDYASKLSAPTDIQKIGFTFIGWTPDVPATVPAYDQTYIAKWEVNKYKVNTISENGIIEIASEIDLDEVSYGTELILNAVANDGFEFIGWSDGVVDNPRVVEVTEDVTYTALFDNTPLNTFTVTFVDWNDTILLIQIINVGQDAQIPDDPIREGYTFIGWDNDLTNIQSNLTVKAQYVILSFSVVFVDKDGKELKIEVVDYGNSATAPEAPLVEGYEFIGWNIDYSVVNSDMIIKALYKEAETIDYVPQNLNVIVENKETNDAEIIMSWDEVEGADSYEIRLIYQGITLFLTNTNNEHEIHLLLSALLEQIVDINFGAYLLDWQVRSIDIEGNAISEWAVGEQFEIEVPIITRLGAMQPSMTVVGLNHKVVCNGHIYIITFDGKKYGVVGNTLK